MGSATLRAIQEGSDVQSEAWDEGETDPHREKRSGAFGTGLSWRLYSAWSCWGCSCSLCLS